MQVQRFLFISLLLRVIHCPVSAQIRLPWSVASIVRYERDNMQSNSVPNLGPQFLLKHLGDLELFFFSYASLDLIPTVGLQLSLGSLCSKALLSLPFCEVPCKVLLHPVSYFCCFWKSALILLNLIFYCIHICLLYVDKYAIIFSSICESLCSLYYPLEGKIKISMMFSHSLMPHNCQVLYKNKFSNSKVVKIFTLVILCK